MTREDRRTPVTAPAAQCRLADLIESLGPAATLLGADGADGAGGAAAVPLRDATHDSRRVTPGSLYAALPGSRVHGAEFAAEAVGRGAVAILTDPAGVATTSAAGVPVVVVENPRAVLGAVAARVHGDPTTALTVLGVTGTNGKTTTGYLLEAGLRAAGESTGLVGTIETRIGGEAVPSERTTPEATDLQALFARMRDAGVRTVVMEVSSHALALGRVGGVRFAAGLFTNLSQDHLDFHGDLESYFAAKSLLFDGRAALEVVNVDDAYGRRLVRPATVRVSARSTAPAGWRAADAAPAAGGLTTFTAVAPDGARCAARVHGPGAFGVANALLALATLVELGVDPADAVAGIGDAEVPGRMQPVRRGQPFLAVVDYAHTPDAVAAALAALRPVTSGRVICVLGAGGDRDRAKRPMMGAAAARGADVVVITDDNPRSEDPASIRAAVRAGAESATGARVCEIPDRADAVVAAVTEAGPGDTVLLAGKGHETTQDVGGVLRPFDDREVLAAALEQVAR